MRVFFIGGPMHGRQDHYPERPFQSRVEIKAVDTYRLMGMLQDGPAIDLLEERVPWKLGCYGRLATKPKAWTEDDGTGGPAAQHYTVQSKEVWAADRERNTLTLFWEGWAP